MSRFALSDEFEDAVTDGKSLQQAIADYRASRGHGDGGWGEYLAAKIEFSLDATGTEATYLNLKSLEDK